MCFQPVRHLLSGGGGKAPNPMETIIFIKEILSPFLDNGKAKCKSWYKQGKQHQIIEELGLLHEALMAVVLFVLRAMVRVFCKLLHDSVIVKCIIACWQQNKVEIFY